jgi:hypothetical protein
VSADRRARARRLREQLVSGTYEPKPKSIRRTTTAEIRDVVVSEIREMRVQIEEHRKSVKNVGLEPDYLSKWDARA